MRSIDNFADFGAENLKIVGGARLKQLKMIQSVQVRSVDNSSIRGSKFSAK